jgi:urea carboxylase
MGIKSVAVYSDADRFTKPVLEADESVRIGPASASESYLCIGAIVAACRRTGAEAVHPGYGFLSENASFVRALADAGVAFIGPGPEHLELFGLKHTARDAAQSCGLPLLPGSGLLETAEAALSEAERIGYPVMLKSVAGGGGIGMTRGDSAEALAGKFETVKRTAQAGFSDARLYLERFIVEARHIEAQIFGDGKGGVVVLGERDCSLQRRNQKIIEETPAPHLPEAVRKRLHDAAMTLAASVNYESAGTVEFIYDVEREEFYFLEVNTRLQVEHPVTEAVFGVDLVEAMIRQAAGEEVLPGLKRARAQGAAVEARLYAENPAVNFRPSAGLLTDVVFPAEARIDSWIERGTEVTPLYDPLLAKIIVSGESREEAVSKLQAALNATRTAGIVTNLDYLKTIAASEIFQTGRATTSSLPLIEFQPSTVDVIAPGAQSTVQALPARLGLWDVGVPPSGPMDERSFRLANKAVGNDEGLPAMELTASGPTLRFNRACVIALAGADMGAVLDGVSVPNNEPVCIARGQILTLGRAGGPGQRAYLAVSGGFEVPEYLGSRATFILGGFGGHAIGPLKTGDALKLASPSANPADAAALGNDEIPELTNEWTLSVVYGPHGAPDFFTERDIETLFSAEYQVHFNSARTGIRLIGPKPEWARPDGGEAGLHPSNIHDNAYAVGSIDFTGDMPIILGPDGPSLGGFVCPAVVAREDIWKLGQLRPGDKVRFVASTRPADPVAGPAIRLGGKFECAILASDGSGSVPVVYRRAGDDNVLVEYGPMVLDIGLRLRVHLLSEALKTAKLPSLIDLTPGIRSLQVHYDGSALSRPYLLGLLREIEQGLPSVETMRVPSRIVHMPLSWNDPQAVLAMRKYQELVRPDAPWCPSNIEFIRRINGLPDEDAVKGIVFDASYFVLGLGDVYLGAPVATPLDPRHRLVTTKYNPARTWTPENAVGIGGAYMCIYGMEGPGGYQLFGRTIPVWNSWRSTDVFEPGKPWLLRFFDQIRFFEVSESELLEARAAFPHGSYPIRIEERTFAYGAYRQSLEKDASEVSAFQAIQRKAFEEERARWKDLSEVVAEPSSALPFEDDVLADGHAVVRSEVSGNVWKVLKGEGDPVKAGEPVLIVESMKMEVTICSPSKGTVASLRAKPGQTLALEQVVAVIRVDG